MNKLITFLILFSTQIFSQAFLGISYNNSEPTNSTNLSLIQKITFSSTDITFLLTDNSTIPKTLSTITKITFSGTNGGNPLPVELVNFAAQVNGNSVTLEWSTATEVNNYGFEVERRIKNEKLEIINWQIVGFVEGNGNSNSPKDYSFVDKTVLIGKYSYRLKQIDNDGKYEYSAAIEVDLGTPKDYNLSQNYPNPFNPSTTIKFVIPKAGKVILKIYDITGVEITELINSDYEAGYYDVELNASALASGVYIYRLQSNNFIAVKKLVVLK